MPLVLSYMEDPWFRGIMFVLIVLGLGQGVIVLILLYRIWRLQPIGVGPLPFDIFGRATSQN